MSVVSIKPAPGQGGNFRSVTDSETKKRWHIVTSVNTDDLVYVRNYGQTTTNPTTGKPYLPTPYVTEHETLPQLLCTDLQVEQDRDHPRYWSAVAKYSSRPFNDTNLQMQAVDPLHRNAEISMTTVQYQQAFIVDMLGQAVTNSAGDPFDPPVETQRSRWVFTVTKNMTSIPAWLPDYENAVNNDTFTIDGVSIPQYKARLSGISISPIKREKIATGVEYLYRQVSFKIELNRDAWHPLKILDQGYRYKSGTSRLPITEDAAAPYSRPVTTPRLLYNGAVVVDPTPANAHFVEFQAYPLKPFTGYIPVT